MTAAMMFAASGYVNADTPANTDKPVIGKQEIRIKNKKLTPEALWAMGRIGSSSVSPDMDKRRKQDCFSYSCKRKYANMGNESRRK